MIMVGVISLMSVALPVDPNRVSATAMAFAALAVGGLVTIGSVMVEILRNLIEGRGGTGSKLFGSIIISHVFIFVYPLISAIVLIGGSFAGASSTQLFKNTVLGGWRSRLSFGRNVALRSGPTARTRDPSGLPMARSEHDFDSRESIRLMATRRSGRAL